MANFASAFESELKVHALSQKNEEHHDGVAVLTWMAWDAHFIIAGCVVHNH